MLCPNCMSVSVVQVDDKDDGTEYRCGICGAEFFIFADEYDGYDDYDEYDDYDDYDYRS